MPTIPEIKKELDNLGVEYPNGAKKADLERLLEIEAPPTKDRVIHPTGFFDPNANPETQA